MANTLLNTDLLSKEALIALENNLGMAANVTRRYEDEYVKVGDTIRVPKPVRYTPVSGATATPQDTYEYKTDVAIDKRYNVCWQFTSKELALDVEEIREKHIVPSMRVLANKIDSDLCDLYKEVYNSVGTPGTTPATAGVLGDAGRRLMEEGAVGPKYLVNGPAAHYGITLGNFHQWYNQDMAKDITEKAKLGRAVGFEFSHDQNIKSHTVGDQSTGSPTPVMNGATAEGATSVVTNGWGGSNTVKEGDVFTIAAVYAVNPDSLESTGVLRQFVVTADAADVGADMTIAVSPTIRSVAAATPQKAYATVDALPLTGAALTFFKTPGTTYPQNLAFCKDAFGLITCKLAAPHSTEHSFQNYKGIGLRVAKYYSGSTDQNIFRVDVQYGVKCYYPEQAVRIWG